MIKKLRIKFVCVNMLIVLIILGGIFGLIISGTRSSLEEQSLREMSSIAVNSLKSGNELGSLRMHVPYFSVKINKNAGLVTVNGSNYELSDHEMLSELINAVLASGDSTGTIKDYRLRYYRLSEPEVETLVFADISGEINTMSNLVRTCLLVGAVSLLAFGALSLLLSAWAIDPVKRAWEQQKQFVSDASHEMKTPLTVILTNAEMLQSGEYSQERGEAMVNNIVTMSTQMRGLVENLLDLARADNGTAKVAFSTLDLSSLVSDSLLIFEPLFYERGLSIAADVSSGIHVNGSDARLKQLVEILLDNAKKYAAASSEVVVSLARSGSHCQLKVGTVGEALSGADLKNIFKRFYRMDSARKIDGSYGLGLPIAEAIAHSHGGKIWAESSAGLNTFIVQLPLTDK